MDINKHLERAREAVKKRNYDFAISLYVQALEIKPDQGDARMGLLQAALKRFEFKRTPKLLRILSGLPHFAGIAAAKIFRNQAALARAGQRYLLVDPTSAMTGFLLGGALEASGHFQGACAVYEFLVQRDGKNIEALKKAGFVKYRLKKIHEALEIFEKVLAVAPRDAEAEKMRKNLAAEDTLAAGSYTKARSSADLVKNKEEAAQLQSELRIHRDTDELEEEEARLRKELESGSQDKRTSRSLGDLLVRKKDYGGALKHFQNMLQEDPASYDVKSRVGDVKIIALRDKIEKAKSRLRRGDDAELKKKLALLRRNLLKLQEEEYAWRVKEHPTDLNLRYKLGQCVFRAGKVDAAIESFQHSVKDPRYKLDSLRMLGRCFREKELFDLARKQFESALSSTGEGGDKAKDIIYDLGDIAERVGDRTAALSWYSKIYEIDIGFRDVAVKIESLKE